MSASMPNKVANQKILVVDDNPASLYATVRILKAGGFEVIEADTGAGALAAAENETIGLFILDINLPDIDGLEVCRRLRARSQTAYLPIIHLTATFVGPNDMTQGLSAGGDSYLTHPVDPPVLIATVRALLFARQADILKRTTDARFRTIFELASSGIALMDHELTYRDVNPEFCRLAGRERNDIIGKTCSELMAPGHEDLCKKLHEALGDGGRWEGTMPVARPDGTVSEVEWRIVAENGRGVRIAIATNVTERERMLESERAARAEAERSNRLKDEFLATLSHEMRTPLSAVLGWSRMLSSGELDPVKAKQAIEAIQRNAQAQARIVDDILDVARGMGGDLSLDLKPFDLVATVRGSVETVSPAAAAKQIHMIIDAPAAVPIIGDPDRLQQVVWNLLSNALKFTPPGGQVTVAVGTRDGSVELRVTDTGAGIPPAFLPYVFDKFRQADASFTRQHGGLGLGLAIARHLVELHGGSIEARSDGEGSGATFVVRLPLGPRAT
jgi:PAS domain S-box-containing protein